MTDRVIRLIVDLTYDDDIMHGMEQSEIDWFHDQILTGDRGELSLHSNDIGDTLGNVSVIEIVGVYPPYFETKDLNRGTK